MSGEEEDEKETYDPSAQIEYLKNIVNQFCNAGFLPDVWFEKFYKQYKEPNVRPQTFGKHILTFPPEILEQFVNNMSVVDMFMFAQSCEDLREIVIKEGASRQSMLEICFVNDVLKGDRYFVKITVNDEETVWDFGSSNNQYDKFKIVNVGGTHLVWEKEASTPGKVMLKAENMAKSAGILTYELLALFPNTRISNIAIDIDALDNVQQYFNKSQILECQKMALCGRFEIDDAPGAKVLFDKFNFSKLLIVNKRLPDEYTHEKLSLPNRLVINKGEWVGRRTLLSLDLAEISIRCVERTLLTHKDFNDFIKHWLNGGFNRLQHFQIVLPNEYELTEEQLMDGITRLPVDPNRGVRLWRGRSFNNATIDIQRENGLNASIVFGINSGLLRFEFVVWYERCYVLKNGMTTFEEDFELLPDMSNYDRHWHS